MGLVALFRAWSLESYLGKSVRSELIYAWSHDMSDELTYSMLIHVQGRGTEQPYIYLTVIEPTLNASTNLETYL